MATEGFAPVLEALGVLSSNAKGEAKEKAHQYLNDFQKSKETWATTHEILSSADAPTEAKLFAVTTMKGKITYDLDQLPREQLPPLRDSILHFLIAYGEGPRPIRTQLCVCLAILAIQMTEWKDVLNSVGSALGASAGDAVLEFLKVLPEEVFEGRKINLTEEELDARSRELVEDNAGQVLQLMINYSGSSEKAASNPFLLECITSWLREIPVSQIVRSPLLDTIMNAVGVESSFDSAVECLSSIFRDTREVDESIDLIQILYPRLLTLRPKLKIAGDADDSEALRGLTRIFAEAGEAWVVLIGRLPKDFRGLVEAILEACIHDKEKESVRLTFNFWFDLKQMVVLEKWEPARKEFLDIYTNLVDVMVKHLEFPSPEGNESDLFDGDRELEEKFREFRHEMGDVLKDCCEVISVTTCLDKAFNLINKWGTTYASQASDAHVPHWQELEAPLFAMRAMGRMVPPDESQVLHQVLPLIVQIPQHEKLQFQAIMAIGRYTEWTAAHPEFLQPQFKFVVKGFSHPSVEVVRAAALAFRFFGQDCRSLLQGEIEQIQGFYDQALDRLPTGSQEELTEGVANIISGQPLDKIYAALKSFCDPIVERLKERATAATNAMEDKSSIESVASTIALITIFVENVQPRYEPGQTNQAVAYCQEIFPVLSQVGATFTSSAQVLEPLCRCWRTMVFSYRTAIFPLLDPLAQQLSSGFETTRQGCFLWATTAVLREFAADETVDAATSRAIYQFFEQQAFAFLKIMDDMSPQDLPDVIEDFFRLLQDALLFYHNQLLPAPICEPILNAAISALSLESEPPVKATLHFLRDLLSYGTDNPASSTLETTPTSVGNANKDAVLSLVRNQGESLVQRVLTGMMFSFPAGCLQDASGTVLGLYQLAPGPTTAWISQTIDMLPEGSVKSGEKDKLLHTIGQSGNAAGDKKGRELQRVRALVADFTAGYRRRNVMPREGLGRLGGQGRPR